MSKPIMIDIPEMIETSRLSLHMPQAGWGAKLHEAIVDGYEDCIKWLNWAPSPPTVETVEEECRRHHADFILRDFIRYVIVEKKTGRVVGRCALPSQLIFWSIPQFGISYFIRRDARGLGYATEATRALTQLAFRTLGAKKVEVYCDSENYCSQNVPKKLGFRLECKKMGAFPRPGKIMPELHTYSLFSEAELSPDNVF